MSQQRARPAVRRPSRSQIARRPRRSAASAPETLMFLQRSAGNQAVSGLVGTLGSSVVVQRDCVARGDAAAVRALLVPAVRGVLEKLIAQPDLELEPELVTAVGKALSGHADATQTGLAGTQAGKVAAVRETVSTGGSDIEYDVPLALAALDGLHRDASGLEGITVSAGLRHTVRVMSGDIADTITHAVLGTGLDDLWLANLRRDVTVAATAAGDATALLRLELEGTIDELLTLRTTFASASDEDERADAGEAIGRTARQALLLNDLLVKATNHGGTGPTPLDTAVEARAAAIHGLRNTATDEESTAKALGDDVKLLGEQAVSVRHGESRGDVIEALGDRDQATVLPEEALPETTDTAELKWAEQLTARIKSQRDEVKGLRNAIVPQSPSYTLAEFVGVHKRWYAFQSRAQEEQDPMVQLALGFLGEPYKLLGTDVGSAGVAVEGGIARWMLMDMAVDQLSAGLGRGSSTQFGGEIARQGPRRVAAVSGTAGDARYDYGELYPGVAARTGSRANEVASRTELAASRAQETALKFSTVAAVPTALQPSAARGAGLTAGPDVPLIGMRSVQAREGWSYLVNVYGEPTRDTLVAREHKVVPRDVADYVLARQQQLRTLEQVHVPEVGGRRFMGRTVGATPLGATATRGGGVEAATATSTDRYLGGEQAPEVPDEVKELQKVLAEQKAATGVRATKSAPRTRPEDVVGALVGDLRTYLDAFFAERQDMEWRLAAIFSIANEEHQVGAQLMKLIEAGTLATMIAEAVKVSAIMMVLQALGPLGQIAAAAYAAYLQSQGVSNVTALISIAGFCRSAAGADGLTRARAWGYVARNVADDAAELFENMVTSPVTAGMQTLTSSSPTSPRELADSLAPMLKDPAARADMMARLDAEIARMEADQSQSSTPSPELQSLRAFRDSLLGRSTPETAKAAEDVLPGAQNDSHAAKLLAPNQRSARDLSALQAAMGDLAPHVPVVENHALPGNEVRVRYNDAGGLRVEIGPHVQPEHVRRHVETARVLRRYEGVMGRVFTMLSRVRQLITGHPAYGKAGFESHLEVRKLKSIIAELESNQRAIEAKADRLTGPRHADLKAEAAAIRREIEALEAQLARHEANLDSYEAGRGFVAAEDTTPPSAGAVKRAQDLIAKATAAAPAVRGIISGAVAAHGGTLAGLEYEIKTEESLARKINDRASERGKQTEKSLDKSASRINDALRYTAVFADASYMQGYAATRKALEDAGYKFVRAGDAWAEPERFGGGYRGINATFVTPDGLQFELQFHTQASWDMKQETHPLYEEARNPKTSPERLKEIQDEQRRRWATVPVPPGAGKK